VAEDVLGAFPDDQAVFARGYVEKVRGEAQRYRTEAEQAATALGQYNNVFGVYDDADRQVWLDLASTWATDPARAARIMQEIAGNVLAEDAGGGSAGAATPGATDDDALEGVDTTGMSPEQVKTMISEAMADRDKKASEQQAIDGIYAEMRTGGFDPESRWGMMVLHAANHETSGDIAAAMKLVQADRQAIIDDYVAGRANGTRAVPSPSNGVVASTAPEAIHNFDDARKAAEAYIRQAQTAQPG
jgi:hypothetical protein